MSSLCAPSSIRIHTKDGHLTATNKRAISKILEAGMMHAMRGRTEYLITNDGNDFLVMIKTRESNDRGQMVDRFHSAAFSTR